MVQEAERILRVTEAPQHLLLTLLRFHYDKLLQRRGKITTQVNYPQRLEFPVNDRTVSYVLYAVVIHSGVTLDGGHYYTLARSSVLGADEAAGQPDSRAAWYMFNDSQVSRTDFETLINLSRKYPTDTPYLLIYRRAGDGAGADAAATPLLLPADLKQMVDDDNAKFVREKLQSVNRSVTRSWRPPKDHDDEQDSQRDNLFTSASRFVC